MNCTLPFTSIEEIAKWSFYTLDELKSRLHLTSSYDTWAFSCIVKGCVKRKEFSENPKSTNPSQHDAAPDISKTAMSASRCEKGVRPYSGLTKLIK